MVVTVVGAAGVVVLGVVTGNAVRQFFNQVIKFSDYHIAIIDYFWQQTWNNYFYVMAFCVLPLITCWSHTQYYLHIPFTVMLLPSMSKPVT